MSPKKNTSSEKTSTNSVADSQTTSKGSSSQTPPGGSFTPLIAKHGSPLQQAGWQHTATSWSFWVSTRFSHVGAAASKHGSTWQEHNDFYTIGLLLPSHLELVPKLLKLFPIIEELTAVINAVAGDKGNELDKLYEAGILLLLSKSVSRLTALLEADINDKLTQLQKPTFDALQNLPSSKEIHLIKQLKVAVLNAFAPVMGAASLEKYANCLTGAELADLTQHGPLLAKMQPEHAKVLVKTFGTAGFIELSHLPVPTLELLSANAAIVSDLLPDASDVVTHLKKIPIEKLAALCTSAGTANLRILLKERPVEEFYKLAALTGDALAKEANMLVAFGHISIGWQELDVLGRDNARKFGEGNQGTKQLAKQLKKLSGEWKQLKNASYSIGEAVKILITTKKPEKARKIITGSISAAKLHEAVAAITELIADKEQLAIALATTPALFNALTTKGIKKLLSGMTIPQIADFVTVINNSAKLNELLVQDIDIKYLARLTGAHTATLLAHIDAARIKVLADNLTVDKLTEAVKDIPATPLKNLLSGLTSLEFANFVKKCGIQNAGTKKGLITLESCYTTASLKHYGYSFFDKFQGVTDATMQHVINGDGINNGVSGCHDRAKFKAQKGVTIISDAMRAGTAIYDVTYTVPPDSKVYMKTLINNLNGNKADWRRRATEALDYAIRKQYLIGDGWFGSSVDGYNLRGYYGGKTAHVMDTFYIS